MSGRQRSVHVYVDTAGRLGRCSWERCMRRAEATRRFFPSSMTQSGWKESKQSLSIPTCSCWGPQYPAQSRNNFGIFLDSSPDRWGRLLMQRRENLRARQEGRKPRRLTDWDYLLGVHDETRLGALRFRPPEGGEFLDSDRRLAAPPITSVRELQAASRGFERHIDEEDNPEYARWLNQLLAPGSSLGGARPKASVRDEKGALCIAKFPSRTDTRDMAAWEMLAHRLGEKCRHSTAKSEVVG